MPSRPTEATDRQKIKGNSQSAERPEKEQASGAKEEAASEEGRSEQRQAEQQAERAGRSGQQNGEQSESEAETQRERERKERRGYSNQTCVATTCNEEKITTELGAGSGQAWPLGKPEAEHRLEQANHLLKPSKTAQPVQPSH